MGNSLISPRNAKVFSYNSPERTKVPSLLPDLTTVKLLIERQDWRGLQQILLDNKEWFQTPTSKGGCMIAGKHPLHHALCVNAPKFLIETILSIDISSINIVVDSNGDEKGFQAIHFAVKYKTTIDVIETILKYDDRAYEKIDNAGRLPLHIALLAGSNLDIIKYFIELHPVSIKTRTKSGGFPLHLALEGKCEIDVIRFLLERNPETARQSYNSNLPLHVACAAKCSLDVFELVRSFNENAVLCYGEESRSVLHFAVANKCCIEIIRKLIDLNDEVLIHRDKTARMPIHYAIESRVHDDIFMLLMDKSPQSVSCRGRGTPGNYPLAMAIEKNISSKIVLEMIRIYPAAVKQKTVYGMFPLRSAIREKMCIEVILALLDIFPEGAGEIDEHGRVALHYAASRDCPIILIDALISSYPLGIAKADRNNQIPLHLACIRLCSLSLIRLLLDRFRQGARFLDKYQNTPLNYIIENNGGIEYYRALVESDKKCMEIFPPDLLTKEQGKLPLHQAIEFQRGYDVIEYLVKSYPDGCTISQTSTGKLALHLAIVRPLPIQSLLVIEEQNPKAALVADNDGLYPVHYAINMKTDSQLIERLLRTNQELTRVNHFPLHMKKLKINSDQIDSSKASNLFEDDQEECCQGNRLLLHYAIDQATSPENVAEILKYTMPFECETGKYFPGHFYTWTHVIAHTHDLYWKSIEIVLQPYSSSIISLLSEFLDEHHQKAIDIATPQCHRVILYRLHYYARYELPTTKNIHLTNITMLKRGIDHFQGRKVNVILKFMSCLSSFLNEIKLRESVALDDRYVVPMIQYHNGDEDYNYREESVRKRFEEYRYLIVLKAGNQSLEDIIRHDFVSPTSYNISKLEIADSRRFGDVTVIKNYARQILLALKHLHEVGVCHGNLHPGHIIEYEGSLKIADFAFACRMNINEVIKGPYGRHSLAYAPPEVAQIYLESLRNSSAIQQKQYSVPVSISVDMWSFGAIMYYLCTGEELFLTSFEGMIDQDQIELLAKWPLFAKTKRMKKIKDPVARNLIEQLLSLEVRLRPSVVECLSHPYFDQSHDSISDELPVRYIGMPAVYDIFVSYRHTPLNRTEEEKDLLDNGRLQKIKKAKGIDKYLLSDGIHCQEMTNYLKVNGGYRIVDSSVAASSSNSERENELTKQITENGGSDISPIKTSSDIVDIAIAESKGVVTFEKPDNQTSAPSFEKLVYDRIFRHITNSKVFIFLISRFAVNCDELSIATLTRYSPCHYFLFELRLALELLSRGMIEHGLFGVAYGDLLPNGTNHSNLDELESNSSISSIRSKLANDNQDEWIYQAFFHHFQQEITLSSGNAFPTKLPDVVVDELESTVAYYLQSYGFGKLHHPKLSIKEMFQQLLQMPIIHVQGQRSHAKDIAHTDIFVALQQKLNTFATFPAAAINNTTGGYNSILSMSRPQTSAFQRMLDARIPSPDFNQRTQTNWFKDREPLAPKSPLHNYTINEIMMHSSNRGMERTFSGSRGGVFSRGGIHSRHGLQSSHGLGNGSYPLKSSKLGPNSGIESTEEKEGVDDAHGQDVQFFDNPVSNPAETMSYTSNFQLHQQNQPKQSLPFFTEIVSLDKATSEEMMHFLVEKMEVRDTEVNNLILELTLMEERIRLQQLEIHRLRSLVQVTHTVNMGEDNDHI